MSEKVKTFAEGHCSYCYDVALFLFYALLRIWRIIKPAGKGGMIDTICTMRYVCTIQLTEEVCVVSNLLTLPRVAELLKLSLSTLRYRVSLYSDYIPHTMQGKYKVYDKASISIIQQINQYYETGKDVHEIQVLLSEQYDRQITVQPEQAVHTINEQTDMTLQEKQVFLLERMVEHFVNRQTDMQQEIQDLSDRIAELEAGRKWWKFW